jgi:hypothetical protein
VTGDFLNMVQEELAGVVEGASLVLDRTNHGQLLAAIQALVSGVMPTGFRGATTDTVAPAGWVRGNGLTIGDAASNATERHNADTLALFTRYWNNRPDLQLYNSGGAAIARGASAAADWALHCAIATPDYRDRVGIGQGTMGAGAANRVTVAHTALDTSVLGNAGGADATVLVENNLPPNTAKVQGGSGSGGGSGVPAVTPIGAAAPVAVVQPSIVELVIIKL